MPPECDHIPSAHRTMSPWPLEKLGMQSCVAQNPPVPVVDEPAQPPAAIESTASATAAVPRATAPRWCPLDLGTKGHAPKSISLAAQQLLSSRRQSSSGNADETDDHCGDQPHAAHDAHALHDPASGSIG